MPSAPIGDAVEDPGHRDGWRGAWSVPAFRVRALATGVALPLVLAGLSHFLRWVETRPGTVVLADPVLAALPARDLSGPIFALIYGGLLLGLSVLVPSPWRLLRAVQAYVLVVLARILCMWLTPLAPPEGFVELHDPLVESFGPAQVLTRDLFFSGHSSTLFLLALAMTSRLLRATLLVVTVAAASLLVWQHVHYTVDVVVAPFIAFAAYEATGSRRVSGCTMRL